MVESLSRVEKGKCPTLPDGDHKIDFSLPERASKKRGAGRGAQRDGEDRARRHIDKA